MILLRPIITEKTMKEAARSRYTFLVERRADKKSIAKVVGDLFGVKVESVGTVVTAGKGRRFGRRAKFVRGQNTKKAVVSLASGQVLDLFEVKGQAEGQEQEVKTK